MKNIIKTAALALALGVSALAAQAQDNGGPPDGPPGGGPDGGGQWHHPPPPLLFTTLDTNRDGVIDSNEIANASAALTTLAQKFGGEITMKDLRPPRPQGTPGEGSQTNQASGWGSQHSGGPGGRHHHPPDPLFMALDTNHDRTIDSNEIASASTTLTALAQKYGGQITLEDLRPQRPPPRDGDMDNGGPPQDGMGGPPPDDGNGPPQQGGQGGPPPGPPGQ